MRGVLTQLAGVRRAVVFYACLLLAGWLLGSAMLELAIPERRPMSDPAMRRLMIGTLALFVLASAIPFVPGAEIGLALLLVFGAPAAPLVYLGMVGALSLAYGVARLVPTLRVYAALRWLGLDRAARLLRDLDATPPDERAALLAARVPARLAGPAIRNRYLLLGLAFNIPGNSVVGGGGGLAFMAALSGLYGAGAYLCVVLLAVAPVPLAFALAGIVWP